MATLLPALSVVGTEFKGVSYLWSKKVLRFVLIASLV